MIWHLRSGFGDDRKAMAMAAHVEDNNSRRRFFLTAVINFIVSFMKYLHLAGAMVVVATATS
jgi:hypothetical protein